MAGMEHSVSPEELREVLSRNLRSRRKELGMTQSELAELAGVSQPNVSDYEAGRIMPSLDTLALIGEALGLGAHALLDPSFFSSPTR